MRGRQWNSTLYRHKMKEKILIGLLLFVVFGVNAQQSTYEYLASAYCPYLQKVSYKNKAAKDLQQDIIKSGALFRSDYNDTIMSLLQQIKSSRDSMTEAQVRREYARNFNVALIEYCPWYIRLQLYRLGPPPAGNKTLDQIAIQFGQVLAKLPNADFKQLNDSLSAISMRQMLNHTEQWDKDYINSDHPYIKDVLLYIFYRFDDFFKAYLLEQTEKLFAD